MQPGAGARFARQAARGAQRFRRALPAEASPDHGESRPRVGAPGRVHGERADATPYAQPPPDDLSLEEERCGGASLVRWRRASRHEQTVRDPHARDTESRAEVERETS